MAQNELTDLAETAASNVDIMGQTIQQSLMYPPGVPLSFRNLASMLARFIGDDTLVAASTTDLSTVPGNYVIITGNTTIAGFGTLKAGVVKYLKFSGTPTITYNATSMILPGLASITAAAGDTAVVVSEGTGNWRMLSFMRAANLPVTTTLVHGQCRIALTGGNIVLSPFGGNGLRIAGVYYAIPSAGVSLAPGVLATGTDLNVYAYMVGTTMTLEAVTTGHSKDTAANNIGIEIKTGDNTRTLVGKVRLIAGPLFADSAAQRFVLNWFNRQGIGVQAGFTADRSTASGTFVELNTEIRCEFLSWSDEAVAISLSGAANNSSAGRGVVTAAGVDGATPEPVHSYSVSPSAGADYGFGLTLYRHSVTEGYHFYTVIGRTDGVGTATYRGNAAANGRTLLTLMTRG